MNKERTALVIALISSAICLGACGGAKKQPEVSESSSLITTVAATTQTSETEAPAESVPEGDDQKADSNPTDPSDAGNTISAEYTAEVGGAFLRGQDNR